MTLKLDRMALDDVGANPIRVAKAIHGQLGQDDGPVPVFEIAKALDIVEIREEPLTNLEGALITTPERGTGSMLLNRNSSLKRRRFTAGHELFHFLSPLHRPSSPSGFWCTRQDMKRSYTRANDQHRRQEAEANEFSIELLAPRPRIRRFLQGPADLTAVIKMADELVISREASARRYVSCHDETTVVVFSKSGRVNYMDYGGMDQPLCLRRNDEVPYLPPPAMGGPVSKVEEASADDWLASPRSFEVTVQTLHQRDGHSITLVRVISEEGPAGDDSNDNYGMFARFGV